MSVYYFVILTFTTAVITSNGRATVFLTQCWEALDTLYKFPHYVLRQVEIRRQERLKEGSKVCPHCNNAMIHESDSICKDCKLEISLGIDRDE